MIDKNIPYFNIIMRYDGPLVKDIPVAPKGFKVSSFLSGDEYRWAQMEVDNNDFDTLDNAVAYFSKKYMSNRKKLEERFIGVRNSYNELVGCVICWDDEKDDEIVASVHWLVTDPKEQSKGIGTFLISMLLYRFSQFNMLPVYLHTQPWSYSAIGIYSYLGFRLLKSDSFRGYNNQTELAIPILKMHMSRVKFEKLISEII